MLSKGFTTIEALAGGNATTGTGLGLYQASRITAQMGGTLSYVPDSTLVRFVWSIPC